MSAEAALALLIAALYLKDCLRLLHADEAVMVAGATGWSGARWRAAFGARGFKLAGREPWLANPFTPHAPAYRMRWSMRSAPAAPAPAADPTAALQANPLLWRLAPLVWGIWALLFVLIPLAIVGRVGVVATLWAVALLYLHIVVALALTWAWRQRLALDNKAYAMLAFECLACAPYAANLVRRLSLARVPDEDFTAAAARLLTPQALAEVHRECLARIDEQLEAEPEGSAAARSLQQSRRRFGTPGQTS